MRPVRLELEGFSAYRGHTEVVFDGADLFALTGPTGAGKTAVLDAIAFALYGVVHRLGDRRVVEPAISQGLHEARVRLDFAVGDDRYTATRVVRRQKKGGASTVEARLEGPGGVVAGTAEELTAAIIDLLGLTYDHFTRCVLLPQGEFARLLNDKPGERQELLVSLLDLGLYGAIADGAGRRAATARQQAERLQGRLDELGGATPEALDDARRRAATLAELVAELDGALPAIAELAAAEDTARGEADRLVAEAERLAAVTVPADVAGLAAEERDATIAAEAAAAACERADAALEAAQAALAALPARETLVSLLDAFDRRDQLAARREKGRRVVDEARATLAAAEERLAAVTAELDAARLAADQAAAAHRAHAVRADVVAGEPCPVCLQVVAVLPDEAPPADLAATKRAVTKAEAAVATADKARAAAATDLARAESLLEHVATDLERLETEIGSRERPEVETELAGVAAATDQAAAAAEGAKVARQADRDARARQEAARVAIAEARRSFDEVRDGVAALGAPPRSGADLAAEWQALAGWAAGEVPGRRDAAAAAEARAGELARRRTEALEGLARRCAAAGVEVRAGRSPRDEAAGALAAAEAECERLARQLADAESVRAELAEVNERAEVAASLAMHLDARHFERWLLGEAVQELAAGATELLHTLSGGHYSLDVDGRGTFVVVDHRNADERRSARTLSGGETFLASLALALALAERVAGLAAGSAARLDAIFLDEGFGTLDPDTLDVVASAIEELGASGRMVGIVTHVAELAERVPVRFEVTRTGNASTIVRVDR